MVRPPKPCPSNTQANNFDKGLLTINTIPKITDVIAIGCFPILSLIQSDSPSDGFGPEARVDATTASSAYGRTESTGRCCQYPTHCSPSTYWLTERFVALGVVPSKLEIIEDVSVAVIQASVYCLVGMPDDVKVVVPNPL